MSGPLEESGRTGQVGEIVVTSSLVLGLILVIAKSAGWVDWPWLGVTLPIWLPIFARFMVGKLE